MIQQKSPSNKSPRSFASIGNPYDPPPIPPNPIPDSHIRRHRDADEGVDVVKHVLYHANCYDGFGAAFAAWKKFGDQAEYIPVSYGQDAPFILESEGIFIIDFSYPINTLNNLSQIAPVVVLDHHKTAEEALSPHVGKDNPKIIFDMNKSGALLAWEYFHPETPVPLLIKHISDRDL